jgi:PhoH-like ATPase
VIDTNILVHDPECLDYLIGSDRENKVFIPWVVINELDGLTAKPDIGYDAEKALYNIEKAAKNSDIPVELVQYPSFKNLKRNLDPKIPDHQIIATAHQVMKYHGGSFAQVKLLTKDRPVRILADTLNILVEDYQRDQTDVPVHKLSMREINVSAEDIDQKSLTFAYNKEKYGDIPVNSGIIAVSNAQVTDKCFIPRESWQPSFTALRKNGHFQIISPNVSAFGFKPFKLDDDPSPIWAQQVALTQGLDPSVKCLFLQGASGSGKTTLALALALERRKDFRKIYITRPMIHLEDRDRIGYLKGDLKNKMLPWMRPIEQALEFLKELNKDKVKEVIDRALREGKIEFVALDYIRGTTFHNSLVILDEAQNVTPQMMKTAMTRIGHKSVIIVTGDLGQIDRHRRLNARTSGLAYAMSRFEGEPLVAATNFPKSVRSNFAALAEERL